MAMEQFRRLPPTLLGSAFSIGQTALDSRGQDNAEPRSAPNGSRGAARRILQSISKMTWSTVFAHAGSAVCDAFSFGDQSFQPIISSIKACR